MAVFLWQQPGTNRKIAETAASFCCFSFPLCRGISPLFTASGFFYFPERFSVSLAALRDFMKVYLMDLTVKQENFCQGVAKGLTYSDAYRQAYNASKMKMETINRKAVELMSNGKVAARVEELKRRALQRYDLTVDDIVKELEDARKIARELGQSSAMVSASMGKAKLFGMIVDKKARTDSEGNDLDVPIVSSAELLAIMERRFERIDKEKTSG